MVGVTERLAPECSSRNLKNYFSYWQRFTQYLKNQCNNPQYMREVTAEHAKGFASHLEQLNFTNNTFNKYKNFLTSFFIVLAPFTRANNNPFESVARKKKVKPIKKRDLSMDEIKILIDNANGELKLLFLIGLTTGLRLGDCCLLSWQDVDLSKNIITNINHKTGARVIIGIAPTLNNILQQMPQEQRKGYLMPHCAEHYSKENLQPHFVARIQQHFRDCGIETTLKGTGENTGKRAVTIVGFHSLRHSFATLCGELGTAETATQQLLGHSKTSMTQYYQHQTIIGVKDVANKLDIALSGLLGDIPKSEIAPKQELIILLESMPIDKINKVLEFAKVL